tara:strand:+ start:561 stop:1211 length:651 start_codon:yes stop_codon:yes gene_type:complete
VGKEKKSLFRNPYFWGAVAGIIILPVLRMAAMARRDAPPPLVKVADWQLPDSRGQVTSGQSLEGKLVISHLHFKGCGVTCEKNAQDFIEVMTRFKKERKEVVFISFAVGEQFDPETAKPVEIFAEKEGITWLQLHGTLPEQTKTLIDAFQLEPRLVGQPTTQKLDDQSRLHRMAKAGKIFLLDQNGDLRIHVDGASAHLAGLVRAGLFLLEKGPEG